MYNSLKLVRGREKIIGRKHPWIFSRALEEVGKKPDEGEIVRVEDYNGKFLAMATYHPHNIALRILSFKEETIDHTFVLNRLKRAQILRRTIGLPSPSTNCYRLIHGEGDFLSGLIIDIYNTTAVVQCHHLGIYKLRHLICDGLLNLQAGIQNVYIKCEKSLQRKVEQSDYYHHKSSEERNENSVLENNVQFMVNWETGQKTGFFLDQRDNRQLIAKYATEKRVLNCYAYSGGFSMYCLQNGAAHVTSVDVSQPALDLLDENASINQCTDRSQSICMDVPKYLKEQPDYSWDIIIVDPPAFAKNNSKKHNAVMAYKRLNTMAMHKVKPGGLLATYSCSQVVDSELFYNTMIAASIDCGRNVQVVRKMTQGADHPVNIFHPEGSYLKGLLLYVL